MENQNGNCQTWPGIRVTFGGILPGGVVLELVESSSGRGVELLRWEGRLTRSHRNSKKARSSTQRATCTPACSRRRGCHTGRQNTGIPGSSSGRWSISSATTSGFRESMAWSLPGVYFSTWFPDLCASPITACITGLNMGQIMRLFRLLHVLCRRPLMVAALNTSLPFYFAPTLLINAPSVSTRIGSFWRATNYRGAVIPGPGGTMRSLACAKIIFCETEAARIAWGPEALHIALLPTSQEFPSLIRAGGSTTRGRISASDPHVPAANPVIPAPIRCFFSTKLLRISAGRKPSGFYRRRS